LSESDSQALLDLMLELKAQGVTSDHHQPQAERGARVADTVTVIRDGHRLHASTRRDEE
jgi:putative multiple sugar transport system ATP-binding protein